MTREKEPLLRIWFDDAVYAVRTLVSTPRYSLPALFSLALGIAASTAVFAIFSAIVLRPLPFPNEDELVNVRLAGVSSDVDESGGMDLSYTYYSEFKELRTIFASIAAYEQTGVTISGSGGVRHASAGQVTRDFFDTLRVDAELGRTFTASGPSPDPDAVAVLSHSYWRSVLGGAPVVGTTILVNGKPKTVLGVIADDGAIPAHVDLWLPAALSDAERNQRFHLLLGVVGRLNPGTSIEVARQMLRAVGTAQNIHSPDGTLVYGTMSSLRDSLVGDKRTSAALMLVAVAAFLLLACANVASLLVTRASLRARELAIRSALGAGPTALARQSGLESAMLTLAGGAAGLGLAAVFVRAANQLFSSELEYTPARLDGRVLVAFGLLAVFSTLMIGLAPTLRALRVRPMDSLREGGRSTSSAGARRFRELLVALQVAITLALLASAAVLVRSVQRLEAVDTGFDLNAVGARILLPDGRKDSVDRKVAFARALLERTDHLPGVTAAAIASDLPFANASMKLGLQMEPRAPKENVVAGLRLVGPGYFNAMAVPLLSGRVFTAGDGAKGVHHVVVNRSFATEYVGTLNALGHTLTYHEHDDAPEGAPSGTEGAQVWYDIIGVVEDTLDGNVTDAAAAIVYADAESPAAMTLMDSGFAIVARGTGDPSSLVSAISTVSRDVDRDSALFDVESLGSMVQRSYRQRTLLEQLLGAFALASIILAGVGLYGVTSYAVAERSGEIGIRRALGASRGAIIRMVLGETGVIVSLGIAAGLVCAWSARALLASFVFGVAATEPLIYAGVCVGIGAVAMLAALAPARAAASVTPSRALQVR